MVGWFLIGFGLLLFLFRYSSAYQSWVIRRLRKKGYSEIESLVQKRLKTINLLAVVYVVAGFVFLFSQL